MNPTVAQWLASRDTGISSLAIVAVMEGGTAAPNSYPCDPSDFGRCWRLLHIAPEYRASLDKMKDVSPQWASLVEHWSELETLYIVELPAGKAPKLFQRMHELIYPTIPFRSR